MFRLDSDCIFEIHQRGTSGDSLFHSQTIQAVTEFEFIKSTCLDLFQQGCTILRH